MIELPPCPACGDGVLCLVMRLEATGGVVSGSTPKVVVRKWPWLVCDTCDFTERGEIT